MSLSPKQGEIWWAETEDTRRPVLVITRTRAVPVLSWIVVAPVTRTIRSIPTEIPLGEPNGLPAECCASFDNLQPMSRRLLTDRVGALGPGAATEICRALEALADC